MTALHHACSHGSRDCVQLLLQVQANVNEKDEHGKGFT